MTIEIFTQQNVCKQIKFQIQNALNVEFYCPFTIISL